jgi:RloB-like protein
MKMKDKRADDKLKKESVKRQLEENKKRRRIETNLDRNNDVISEKSKILITCEGKNTEKDYFDKFKNPSLTLEVIGEGDNTISLVKKTIAKIKEKKKGYYAEVWCVFDADPKPDNPRQLKNFNDAIFLANRSNINVAYSHQAFEYWLLLHFNNHQGGKMDRKLYKKSLNKYLKDFNLKYDDSSDDRGKSISNELFDVLMAFEKNGKRRICLAIERAENIYNNLESYSNPAINESSTTVFMLVKRLLGVDDDDNPCSKINL